MKAQRGKPRGRILPYGEMADVCQEVRRMWFKRDEEIPACEGLGFPIDFYEAADQARQAEIRSVLHVLMGCLTNRERTILAYRYEHELTLGEVGEVFDLTKERIRQIEYRAFRRIRENSQRLIGSPMDDLIGVLSRIKSYEPVRKARMETEAVPA